MVTSASAGSILNHASWALFLSRDTAKVSAFSDQLSFIILTSVHALVSQASKTKDVESVS